jgi:hypothetical protein
MPRISTQEVICSTAFCKKKTNPFNYYYIVYYLKLFLKKSIEIKIKSPAFRLWDQKDMPKVGFVRHPLFFGQRSPRL